MKMTRTAAIPLIAASTLAITSLSTPASANGCIKGAIVGGVAGHYAGHHGVLGAAAGCLIGRHEAKKREHEREQKSNAIHQKTEK